eukprot:s23_g3.t1
MREPKLTTSSIPIPWGRKSTPGVRARESLESEQEQRRAALERMAQLSPTELEQLPHSTKVQLLEYLKQSNPQQKQTVKVEPGRYG